MPKYIFAQLAEMKQQAINNGVDVIDISIGNPDGATPRPVVDVAVNAIIGSMLKNGYLSVDENSILVSVKNDDTGKADKLKNTITS
jgi:aspartate/methionine/tyrosine aminotransferase